jgi:SAM-dependent methyltransferase
VSYAEYILRTGNALATWEDAFGRYLYESRFRGRRPILDVGPGRCWFTRQQPSDITGLELEQDLVDRYVAQGLQLRQGSVMDIPFEDEAFQGVFCCWLLEHLPHPDDALREISRVLTVGGYACVIVPSARSVTRGFYDDFTHIRPYTRASLEQLSQRAGFSRYVVNPLFWTRGGPRIASRVQPETLNRALSYSDHALRRVGIVNRSNLMLEAWK